MTKIFYGLSVALAGAIACTALADPPSGTVQDRKGFIPARNHQKLPGKVIGLLLADGQPILSTEGRSGPADQLVFARNGASYRWIYVPAPGGTISNLQVPVGDKGEKDVYPLLDLARTTNGHIWGVQKQFTLAEVEVNGGKGSPAGDSFVATNIKVLDGSDAYPLKIADAINTVKEKYAAYKKEQQPALDKAMQAAQTKAIGDKKATGPRETQDLLFVTWLEDKERLRVHFRTKLSDGNYSYVGGGAVPPFNKRPLPPVPGGAVPVPAPGGAVPAPVPPPPAAAPVQGQIQIQVQGQAQPAIKIQQIQQPPPPPRDDFKVRVGTTFGVEFGMAYEITKDGKLAAIETLPFESFQQVLPPPPQGRPGPRVPIELPPPPALPPAKN